MNDLISRRAAIKTIDDLPNCYNGYSDTYDKAYIIGVLEEVPKDGCEYWDGESGFCALHRPADPVKHGKWKEVQETLDYSDEYFVQAIGFECSQCGTQMGNRWNFCPNCGAKMEVEE